LLFGAVLFSTPGEAQAKSYDLVLVHGLLNMYKWSDAFLDTCLKTYGSGNVYVLYLDGTDSVTTRTVHGRKLYCAGGNNSNAGTDCLADQASYMKTLITKLQEGYGLGSRFSIIAHSMGGLVAREYAVENPGRAADIVCLGTPNQGGHLYVHDYDEWIMALMGAEKAVDDMRYTVNTGIFNEAFPVNAIEFAEGGHLYTIRAKTTARTCGYIAGICELRLGFLKLRALGYPDNDGLVDYDGALIEGGINIKDFVGYSHLDIVRKAEVAARAMSVLR